MTEDNLIIDEAFVDRTLEDFKKEKVLPLKTVFAIIDRVAPILAKEDTLKRIRFSDFEPFVVVGDIHGQFYDLINIFRLVGKPSKKNSFLFNGDFVDRGEFSVEVILTLFLFKILYPDNVTLLRGNHECLQLITNYGFSEELETKYKDASVKDAILIANNAANHLNNNNDAAANHRNNNHNADCYNSKEALARFAAVFRFLPLAAVLNDGVFVCHGGLFKRDTDVLLSDIASIDRFREPPEEGLMCDLLWSDPGIKDGRHRSRRGLGIVFGPDVTKKFLKTNKLALLIRSHEVKDRGYDVQHDGKCVTLFSAPNYCDTVGNMGAVLVFDPIDGVVNGEAASLSSNQDWLKMSLGDEVEDIVKVGSTNELRPRIVEFEASPHPSKDKRSISDKLAEMGLVPRAFPY